MSKIDKLWAGGYIILRDYADGRFPPSFDSQEETHQAEIDYFATLPNVSRSEFQLGQLRKPFWEPPLFERYMRNFTKLLKTLHRLDLKPGHRLLELGCGNGWTAEFLALSGYSVLGTSIAPNEIEMADKRREATEVKGLTHHLAFRVSPMEEVNAAVTEEMPFDGAFVFEALHHAHSWQRAIRSVYDCLRPGGWLLLANEPNVLHTFISYRIARISSTHEIGLSKKALVNQLQDTGFSEIRILQPRWNNRLTEHWIAARR